MPPVRLALVAVLLAAANVAAATPNVLLIVSDDQGYADLGCVGGAGVKTPHLDRLAADGVRATNFYVAWPACTPSRGSLLTGRYPQRNGLYDMIRNDLVNYGHKYTEAEYALSPEMTLGLDLREVTIADVLSKAGYRCGMVGKWDSGRAKRFLPPRRGFDFFYGFANTGIDYWTHERYGVPSMYRGLERVKEAGYATDLFEREAVQFVRTSQGRPWFLYLAFNAPHSASSLTDRGVQAQDQYLKQFPDRDPKAARTKYLAAVANMDHAIGRVLAAVEAAGATANTLVMFLSDNGGPKVADNGPLRGTKAQMFEGGVRVPFVARWPRVLPAGRVTHEFLTALEVFPTVLAAAGAEPPKGVILDGFDLRPVLTGEKPSPRTEMFWQRQDDRAARVGSYKWVASAAGSGLFDLSTDIGEKNDLSSQRPADLARVKARWEAWRTAMDASEPRGPFRDY